MNLACPHCKGAIAADASLAGQTVSCPHCRGVLQMPAIQAASADATDTSYVTEESYGSSSGSSSRRKRKQQKSSNNLVLFGCGIPAGLVLLIIVGSILNTVSHGNGTRLTFNNGEIYYDSTVSTTDVTRLGSYLVKEGYFDGEEKTVSLSKSGHTFIFKMVVKKGTDTDQVAIDAFRSFGDELSEDVFNGANVDVHLCDESLQTLRVLPSS